MEILAIAGMFRYILRPVHGIVGFRYNARTVRPPEITPDKERLILIPCLFDQPVGFLRHKILYCALHRPLVPAKHLLNLKRWIISHKPMRYIHTLKPFFLQILRIIIGCIHRRNIKFQAGKYPASGKPIAHKGKIILKTAFRRCFHR